VDHAGAGAGSRARNRDQLATLSSGIA
jgi:hypothetical protein